jgi:DNA polymerase/3'-5' exonuclease PolX
MLLSDAESCASTFQRLVENACERLMICGSIRRRRPEVGDIDIVAIPKFEKRMKETGFGFTVGETVNLLRERVDRMLSEGLSSRRIKKDGTSMIGESVAFMVFQGVPLDLYYATRETWWGLVQMRTGSAAFNAQLASTAIKLGLRYHADGKGVTEKAGKRLDDGQSEESIFKVLGFAYIPPEERN